MRTGLVQQLFFSPLIDCVNSCSDERTSWGLCSGGQGSCWGRADDKEGRGLPAVQGWSHGGHAAGETSFGQSCIQNDTCFFGFFLHSTIWLRFSWVENAFFYFCSQNIESIESIFSLQKCQLAFHTFSFDTNFFFLRSAVTFLHLILKLELASEKNLLSTDNKK